MLAIRQRELGPEHPGMIRSRYFLANVLGVGGKYAEAEKEHRAVLALPERKDTLKSRGNLATMRASSAKPCRWQMAK